MGSEDEGPGVSTAVEILARIEAGEERIIPMRAMVQSMLYAWARREFRWAALSYGIDLVAEAMTEEIQEMADAARAQVGSYSALNEVISAERGELMWDTH